MKSSYILFGLAAALLGAFIIASPRHQAAPALGEVNSIQGTVTNTSVTVSTTTSLVLAPASGRIYAAIVNSGSNGVYLALAPTSTQATAGQGIYLAPGGGAYEITLDNHYVGAISGITSTGTSTLSIAWK
jgi:hypothetical protein